MSNKKRLILYIKDLADRNPENVITKKDKALLKKYNAKKSGDVIVCVNNTGDNPELTALFKKLNDNGIACQLINIKRYIVKK